MTFLTTQEAKDLKEMTSMKITLDWEQCNLIAKYYEFPATVFLFTKKNMQHQLKGTRKNGIHKSLEKLRKKLDDVVEEAKEVL